MTTTETPRFRLFNSKQVSTYWLLQNEDTDEWYLMPAMVNGFAKKCKIPTYPVARRQFLEPAPGYCYIGLGVPLRRQWKDEVCIGTDGRN